MSQLEKLYNLMISGMLDAMSSDVEILLTQLGLTKEQKGILQKYSYKLFFCAVLEQYLNNVISLNFKEVTFLKMTILQSQNADLIYKLSKFLKHISKENAKNLLKDLYKEIPRDIYSDIIKLLQKLLNYKPLFLLKFTLNQ